MVVTIILGVFVRPAIAEQSTVAPETAWADGCNVPGYFETPQAVCTARQKFLGLEPPFTPLRYEGPTQTDPPSGLCIDSNPDFTQVWGSATQGFYCPEGYAVEQSQTSSGCVRSRLFFGPQTKCVRIADVPDIGKGKGSCGVTAGNPIDAAIANKFAVETDFGTSGSFPFALRRYYSSLSVNAGRDEGKAEGSSRFGSHWTSIIDARIRVVSNAGITTAWVYRPDGSRFAFNLVGGQWLSDEDILERLYQAGDTWQIKNSLNELETYDATGKIRSVLGSTGLRYVFTYSGQDTPVSIAPRAGLPIKMSDGFGREIQYFYDSLSRVSKVIFPAGNEFVYAYDPNGNLSSVQSGGVNRIYHYNEPGQTNGANLPHALTGITDENGIRFATYKYDAQGRAISTEHAGGANKATLSYSGSSTVVTDALNTSRTYAFQNILGVAKNTSVSQPGGSGCGPASASTTYDANGNVKSRTDFNGVRTTYTYDLTRNLELTRTEAVGQPEQRKTSTAWHSYWRLPTKVAEPKKLTTYEYNSATTPCAPADALVGDQPIGVLCSKTEEVTTDATGAKGLNPSLTGQIRAWKYTYNKWGQVLTVNGPRLSGEVLDLTTYSYDEATGNLLSLTNAAGHITTFADYDANGRVGRITDPNGLVTVLTYKPRGWLESRRVGNQLTTYTYDGVGQLTRITLPDGSFIAYTYDDAHRLTDIEDAAGNKIHYSLDAMGNRKVENTTDPGGNLTRTLTREYDALNRLQQLTGVQ